MQKKDNFKFILLEGFVQLSMNEKNRTLQAGNLILTRVQEKYFQQNSNYRITPLNFFIQTNQQLQQTGSDGK